MLLLICNVACIFLTIIASLFLIRKRSLDNSQVHKRQSLALLSSHADASGTGVGRASKLHGSSISGVTLVNSGGRVGNVPVVRDVGSVVVGVCLLLVLRIRLNSVRVA